MLCVCVCVCVCVVVGGCMHMSTCLLHVYWCSGVYVRACICMWMHVRIYGMSSCLLHVYWCLGVYIVYV